MAFLRNRHHDHDPVWHVQITMLASIILQLLLPDSYSFLSRYALVIIEAVLLVALSFTTPKQKIFQSISRRLNVFLLIALTSATNGYSLAVIAQKLLQTGHVDNGKQLLIAGVNIYVTNIIVFGLWYWEIDGGGPGLRRQAQRHERDFQFPQNQTDQAGVVIWQPTFIDYLYVSSTNAMAFSPTDTMPLSRRAKILMLAQATVSLITIALVAARAVNILN